MSLKGGTLKKHTQGERNVEIGSLGRTGCECSRAQSLPKDTEGSLITQSSQTSGGPDLFFFIHVADKAIAGRVGIRHMAESTPTCSIPFALALSFWRVERNSTPSFHHTV